MKNENYLADWLDGKISDDQLRTMVSPEDFDAYHKLRSTLGNYQIRTPSMDDNFLAVKAKLQGKRPQPRVYKLAYYLSAAAMIAIVFGLFQLFSYSESVETGAGESVTYRLADNSSVTLNAKSKVAYPALFRYNRSIRLEGEAYFEVSKGSTFIVTTESGKVRVIGTKFNVLDRNGWFEVVCYEGSVEVISGPHRKILQKGNAFRMFDGKPEEIASSSEPSWMTAETRYENVPLHHVIDGLERQYGQIISYPAKMENTRFTGTLSNTNLGTALRSLCMPLNLRYHESGSGEIAITE